MTPPAVALQETVDAYPDWYHAFDFGNGVKSKPRYPYPEIWQATERFLDAVDFRGKTVLDIGCWDGYWSFYAERRGARSVLATDMSTQRWGATRGFEIAHEIYNSRVRYQGNLSVYDIVSLGSRFDIILFLGVYYHLTHLVTGITALRHTVEEGGLLLVEGSAINNTEKSYMEFLYGKGDEPERIDTSNWTTPTRRCLRDILSANYFEVLREEFPFDAPRGRVLMEAKPVIRDDRNYIYPPPFGLQQYDPRWRTKA